jgi:hypothetical protein
MNNEDRESKRRANHGNNDADVVGLSLTQAVRYLHMDEATQSAEVKKITTAATKMMLSDVFAKYCGSGLNTTHTEVVIG